MCSPDVIALRKVVVPVDDSHNLKFIFVDDDVRQSSTFHPTQKNLSQRSCSVLCIALCLYLVWSFLNFLLWKQKYQFLVHTFESIFFSSMLPEKDTQLIILGKLWSQAILGAARHYNIIWAYEHFCSTTIPLSIYYIERYWKL